MGVGVKVGVCGEEALGLLDLKPGERKGEPQPNESAEKKPLFFQVSSSQGKVQERKRTGKGVTRLFPRREGGPGTNPR